MRLTGIRARGSVRVIALLAVLALAAGACSNAKEKDSGSGGSGSGGGSTEVIDQPGVTADTIRVGGVASITNPLNAPYGDIFEGVKAYFAMVNACLLYTSDAADDLLCVDLGGRR